jgi:4a-hydroxytetrahydrobiopterin dehydratase
MPAPKPLTAEEIKTALADLPGWKGTENGLERKLGFRGFNEALQFMQACAAGIDRLDHHPTWTNTHRWVEIHLDTYDSGHKVTASDVALARHIEAVLKEKGAGLGYEAG